MVVFYQYNLAYIILQNTGDNVTVAFIDNNGASYKKYTYNDLTSYSIVDMSSYYSANCKNWKIINNII